MIYLKIEITNNYQHYKEFPYINCQITTNLINNYP